MRDNPKHLKDRGTEKAEECPAAPVSGLRLRLGNHTEPETHQKPEGTRSGRKTAGRPEGPHNQLFTPSCPGEFRSLILGHRPFGLPESRFQRPARYSCTLGTPSTLPAKISLNSCRSSSWMMLLLASTWRLSMENGWPLKLVTVPPASCAINTPAAVSQEFRLNSQKPS